MSSDLIQRRFTLILIAIVPGLMGASAFAADFEPERLELLHPAMQKYVDNKLVAGVVAAIGSREGIVVTEAVGQLNREQNYQCQMMPCSGSHR